MEKKISNLAKQYVLWPELENDFQKNIDFSSVNMISFKQEIEPIGQRKTIESQIALFYLMNEKLSKIRLKSQDVLNTQDLKYYEQYQKLLNKLSKDILSYIIITSLVEARHHQIFGFIKFEWNEKLSSSMDYDESIEKSHINKKYKFNSIIDKDNLINNLNRIKSHPDGEEFLKTYINFKENNEKFTKFLIDVKVNVRKILQNKYENSRLIGYKNVVSKFLNTDLSDFSIKETLIYLIQTFNNCSFDSRFGGNKWSQIAQHGLDFVNGKINSEMFIDQAFSLEHNNGSVFNKDFLFFKSKKFELYIAGNAKLTTSDFSTDIKTRNNELSTCYLSFSTSKLFLNAQHLGMIEGIFSLKNKYDLLKNKPYIDIYTDLQKNNKFLGYDFKKFEKIFTYILKNYSSITENLNLTQDYLEKKYSKIYNSLDKKTFDFKKVFKEISKRDEYEYGILNEFFEEKDNMFDLWNYLQNEYLEQKNEIKLNDFSFNIFDISKIPKNKLNKEIIGGKAWGLANMHSLGINVPEAKVFTTDCCSSFYQHKELFDDALNKEILSLKEFLKILNKPVLCSIRSGAPISMPGMMDTILNVGIDDSNYDYFCKKMGKKVTHNCIKKFMELFCSSRLDIKVTFNQNLDLSLIEFKEILKKENISYDEKTKFPLDIEKQIKESLYAVFNSWYSIRAKSYRLEKNISEEIGTAAIIQHMVFGNLNDKSCTGVVFSRDCLTAENKLVGEFLPKAQGEDVVSGSITPYPINELQKLDNNIYNELKDIAKKLENQFGKIQDIEFTVENGKLYILQQREAVCSSVAIMKLLEDENINHSSLIQQIDSKFLQNAYHVNTIDKPDLIGLSANPGVISGMIIKNLEDMELMQKEYNLKKLENPNFGWIYYSEFTLPEHMPLMNKTQAFITEQGGFTSHAAIIARSLNKPCIVGLGVNNLNNLNHFITGDVITVDAEKGHIWKKEQNIIENNNLAKSASNFIIKSNKIDLNDIQSLDFQTKLNCINNKNRSWIFNFPEAKYVDNIIVKKEKFLDIGQKFAMFILANNKNLNKNKQLC